jgi:hypothetical protein
MNNFLEDNNYQCLNNSTSAQELGQDSPLQENYSEVSTSADTLKSINGAAIFSINDFQESKISETLPNCQQAQKLDRVSISFPEVPPVNLSQIKENEKDSTTFETVSPQLQVSSTNINPDILHSKTSPDCLRPDCDPEATSLTSLTCSKSFPPAGMMSNGLVYHRECLPVPILEKGFCWLDSPGALSSLKSREPGQTKQEAGLKKLGLLKKGEVLNPAILCEWSKLPPTFLDPLESLTAVELFEQQERQLEICWTGELQPSHSKESSTSIQSQAKFLEDKRKSPKGCLYKYLETKKLKSGAVVQYPNVDCERNPNNPEHWRWGFNWEEKVNGKWKGRSIGVPVDAIGIIKSMQNSGASLKEIISFIKQSKQSKPKK